MISTQMSGSSKKHFVDQHRPELQLRSSSEEAKAVHSINTHERNLFLPPAQLGKGK